jgi:hypothetical protein
MSDVWARVLAVSNTLQQSPNTSAPILRSLPVSQYGLAFVLVFDSAIFLLALLIFFICYKQTTLYKVFINEI